MDHLSEHLLVCHCILHDVTGICSSVLCRGIYHWQVARQDHAASRQSRKSTDHSSLRVLRSVNFTASSLEKGSWSRRNDTYWWILPGWHLRSLQYFYSLGRRESHPTCTNPLHLSNQSFVNGAVIQSYAALSQRLRSTGSHQSNKSANRWVLRRRANCRDDVAECIVTGRSFQILTAAAEKARSLVDVVCPKGSHPEQVEGDQEEMPTNPGSPGRWLLKLDLGVTWVCVHDLTRHQNDLKVD